MTEKCDFSDTIKQISLLKAVINVSQVVQKDENMIFKTANEAHVMSK